MNQIEGYLLDHRKLAAALETRQDKVLGEGIRVDIVFDPENDQKPYADVIVTRSYRLHDQEVKDMIKEAL
jgi:ABC-type metal ion transport system substrate-binding protein